MTSIARLTYEPPLRIIAWLWLRIFSKNVETRARWGVSSRPEYLFGLYNAALQAKLEKVEAISAIEFGVAGGRGLVALQQEAAAVEAALGVKIKVFGFDTGGGLPTFIGDYRDHPDEWRTGDFPMDVAALKSKLNLDRTELILGNVADTVPTFVARNDYPPIGFVSFDLDIYSSTRDALLLFKDETRRTLFRVVLYFDDIVSVFNHKWAGEFLAIDEFNDGHPMFKIDRWYGVKHDKPFPERKYWDKFYVAHDLKKISSFRKERSAGVLMI
jgi:hypothetical protein